MFSKNNQEEKIPTLQEEKEVMMENNSDTLLPNEQQSIVKLVEKISGILSPYFIVIVGLYLYDNNFLFGSILILVGILSLLKISYEDIIGWIDNIKNIFSQNNQE